MCFGLGDGVFMNSTGCATKFWGEGMGRRDYFSCVLLYFMYFFLIYCKLSGPFFLCILLCLINLIFFSSDVDVFNVRKLSYKAQ